MEERVGVEWRQKPGPTRSSSAVICRQKVATDSRHITQSRTINTHTHTRNPSVRYCAGAAPLQGHMCTTHKHSAAHGTVPPPVRKELLTADACESQHKAEFLQDV